MLKTILQNSWCAICTRLFTVQAYETRHTLVCLPESPLAAYSTYYKLEAFMLMMVLEYITLFNRYKSQINEKGVQNREHY